MHYCTLLITKERPTGEKIEEIMSKYYEEDFYDRKEKTKEEYPTFLWDWYCVGGRFEGCIKLNMENDTENVDGAKIKDVVNLDEIKGYNLVMEDGTAYTRCWFNGKALIDNPDYEKQVKEILNNNKDSFLTILDIHD